MTSKLQNYKIIFWFFKPIHLWRFVMAAIENIVKNHWFPMKSNNLQNVVSVKEETKEENRGLNSKGNGKKRS